MNNRLVAAVKAANDAIFILCALIFMMFVLFLVYFPRRNQIVSQYRCEMSFDSPSGGQAAAWCLVLRLASSLDG
jgi:hypothetical protein